MTTCVPGVTHLCPGPGSVPKFCLVCTVLCLLYHARVHVCEVSNHTDDSLRARHGYHPDDVSTETPDLRDHRAEDMEDVDDGLREYPDWLTPDASKSTLRPSPDPSGILTHNVSSDGVNVTDLPRKQEDLLVPLPDSPSISPSDQDGSIDSSEESHGLPPDLSHDLSHDHDESSSPHHQDYLKEIFLKYGDRGVLTFEGFEHLLQSLGLGNVAISNHSITDHYSEQGRFSSIHEDHHHHPGSQDADHPDHSHNSSISNPPEDDHIHDGQPQRTSEHSHSNSQDQHSNQMHDTGENHIDQHNASISSTGNSHNRGDIEPDSNKLKRNLRQASPSDHSESLDSTVRRNGRRHSKQRHHHKKHHLRTKRDAPLPNEGDHTAAPPATGNQTTTGHPNNMTKCMSPMQVLRSQGYGPDSVITQDDFLRLCPTLVFQLDLHVCASQPRDEHDEEHEDEHLGHDHKQGYHEDDHHQDNSTTDHNIYTIPGRVWGFALLSCLVISLVGLLAVALIPIMHHVFYNHIIQFLVALAIGSLVGDALLHLLPHALVEHGHDDHSDQGNENPTDDNSHDKSAIWKGLTGLAGMYFLFLIERLMGIISQWRRKRKLASKQNGSCSPRLRRADNNTVGAKLSRHADNVTSCEEILMVVHPSKDVRRMANDSHKEIHRNCDPGVRDSWTPGQHQHGKGHNHSHGDRVPGTVAAVAWMVIMGDGLHNLSDGLAIGAAFANSLSGGLSTSVAVFCHELPHELGDFAVLLRAGMSVKQALVYNVVSSVLCLVGMAIGVAIGNISVASQWIFALVAGMFIYIALVDMLPEITGVDPKQGENPFVHLILQNLGMMVGVGIMLTIAIYEEDIKLPHFEP